MLEPRLTQNTHQFPHLKVKVEQRFMAIVRAQRLLLRWLLLSCLTQLSELLLRACCTGRILVQRSQLRLLM